MQLSQCIALVCVCVKMGNGCSWTDEKLDGVEAVVEMALRSLNHRKKRSCIEFNLGQVLDKH